MKLQKLIYFTYRDFIQTTGARLFHEPICAWKYGPVVEVVYYHFKPFAANSINRFYRDSKNTVRVLSEPNQKFGEVIGSVWARYKNHSGFELVKTTHEHGSAWHKATVERKQFLSDGDIINDNAR
jgi:uncharacterized phage-associated protein